MNEAALGVYFSVNDTIVDRLCHNVLGVLGGIHVELLGHVRQRNALVAQANEAQSRLYHVVAQADTCK